MAVIALNLEFLRLDRREDSVQGCVEHRQVLAECISFRIGQSSHPALPVLCIHMRCDNFIYFFQFLPEVESFLEKNPFRMLQKQDKQRPHQRPERNFLPVRATQANVVQTKEFGLP